jgi:hypothetical protein
MKYDIPNSRLEALDELKSDIKVAYQELRNKYEQ